MKDYKGLQNGSDIRGVALKIDGGKDVNLDCKAAADLAAGFAVWLSEKLGKKLSDIRIAVGRDCRVTGPELKSACAAALRASGVCVLDCGMASTPAMFMATKFSNISADGSIMFTASHLPMERNGMKFFTPAGGLEKSDISELIALSENIENISDCSESFKVASIHLMDEYCAHLRSMICKELAADENSKPLQGLHIAVDAGNGSGGFYVSDVLIPLGANVQGSQFLEPDGTFPNHVPNPEDKDALLSICSAVEKSGADLGIIFDTDVDRAAAVASDGKEISRNRIVALAACLASEGHDKTTIVTDSVTSTQLTDFLTKKLGCKHLRFKRGYKNVIDKGIELNNDGIDCQLAIETSGHAAMKENYFLDDGAYLATKIIIKAAILKKKGMRIEDLIADLKDPLEAIEVRFKVNDPNFSDYAQSVLDFVQQHAETIDGWSLETPNYEGVRVNTNDGWFLMRKSLHDPVIPLNIESNSEGGTKQTLETIKELIKDFDKLS